MERFLALAPISGSSDKFNFKTANIIGLDCAADLQDNMIMESDIFYDHVSGCDPDAVLVIKKGVPPAAQGGISDNGGKI